MAFSFVRSESEAWLTRAGSPDAVPYDATRAVTALRSDYERWSRWALGLLGFVLAALGAFAAIAMIGALLAWTGPVGVVDVVAVVVPVAMTAGGGALLIRLWRSGRRLASAAAWWISLPYRSGAVAPSFGGWWRARLVNLEPPLLVRLITAGMAFLLAVFGVALLARGLSEGEDVALAIAAGAVGLIAFAAGCGQAGGVMRIVQGFAAGDRVWRRFAG